MLLGHPASPPCHCTHGRDQAVPMHLPPPLGSFLTMLLLSWYSASQHHYPCAAPSTAPPH